MVSRLDVRNREHAVAIRLADSTAVNVNLATRPRRVHRYLGRGRRARLVSSQSRAKTASQHQKPVSEPRT